jgi:hypothetical protein
MRRTHRPLAVVAALLALAASLTGCLAAPGSTAEIELVSSVTVDGWRFDHYRNRAYPCSLSGYQTFLVGQRVGSDPAATRPLWVKMHGGGVGWFDEGGDPMPTAGNKSEESRAKLLGFVDPGLVHDVQAAPEGFRLLVVSMCNHDLYAGGGQPDPDNPTTEPDGTPVTVNGLLATKAAIQFTQALLPTDDFFLHGGSAGAFGTFHVAWGLQQQGIPPAGIVADSGVLNDLWQVAQLEQGLPCARTPEELGRIPIRWHPDVADPANRPDLLVGDGRLRVPAVHIWSQGDPNVCGALPMQCPLRDGTSLTMWSAGCAHEPLRLAIESLGAGSRSINLPVCVDNAATPAPCDTHVVTTKANKVNTDPSLPADYNAVVLAWVRDRLADD